MTTGERMKQRRKEIGFSAEKVAERLGVSPATIYRYEKGDIEKVPVDSLAELARILQTTPAYLMGWEECANSATPQPAPKTVYSGDISDSKIATSHAHSPCPSHRINDTDDRGHMYSSEREIAGANDVSDTENTVSHSCQHVSDNTEAFTMTVGDRIRQIRRNQDITQQELADYVGVSKQAIYKYENNIVTNIPMDKVDAIAKRLKVSPAYLMGWEKSSDSAVLPFASEAIHTVSTPSCKNTGDSDFYQIFEDSDFSNRACLFNELTSLYNDDDSANPAARKRVELEKKVSSNLSSSSVTQPADKPSQQLHQEHNDKQPESSTCLPPDASEHSDYIQELIELPMSDKPQKVLKKTFCDNLLVCSSFPDNIQCDFAMLCDDDSMSGIGICKDDIAYVKKIDFVPRNGTIVAISIDKKALLRRIYSDSNYIEFRPENSGFKAIIVDKSHGTLPEILGILVGFTHCISQSSTEDDFFDFL